MSKQFLICLFAALFAVACFSAPAKAEWPDRPVTFVLGSQAGTSIDVVGRLLAEDLSKKFGQPFIPKNVPGGSLGAFPMAMKNAKADGYTIGMGPDMIFSYNTLEPSAKYTIDDVEYVCGIFTGDSAWVVSGENKQWKDLKDALEWARDNNKTLNYQFQAGIDRALMEAYAKQIGAKVNLVPSQGPASILTSLIGGHADIGFSGGLHYEQARAGKIRTLTMQLEKRSPTYPDVPTHYELFNPSYKTPYGLRLIVVPKGFPKEAFEKLSAALKEIITSPKFEDTLKNKLHYQPAYMPGAELEKLLHEQLENCRELAKAVSKK